MIKLKIKRTRKYLSTWNISFILSESELNALTRTIPVESSKFTFKTRQRLYVLIEYFLTTVNFSTNVDVL